MDVAAIVVAVAKLDVAELARGGAPEVVRMVVLVPVLTIVLVLVLMDVQLVVKVLVRKDVLEHVYQLALKIALRHVQALVPEDVPGLAMIIVVRIARQHVPDHCQIRI